MVHTVGFRGLEFVSCPPGGVKLSFISKEKHTELQTFDDMSHEKCNKEQERRTLRDLSFDVRRKAPTSPIESRKIKVKRCIIHF